MGPTLRYRPGPSHRRGGYAGYDQQGIPRRFRGWTVDILQQRGEVAVTRRRRISSTLYRGTIARRHGEVLDRQSLFHNLHQSTGFCGGLQCCHQTTKLFWCPHQRWHRAWVCIVELVRAVSVKSLEHVLRVTDVFPFFAGHRQMCILEGCHLVRDLKAMRSDDREKRNEVRGKT